VRSRTTRAFRESFAALPEPIREQAREAFRLWRSDPMHNSLHFKKLRTAEPCYSVRIGIQWRALGRLEGDTLVWFWVGSHADYERRLKRR
jgi:hypothetical protein